MAAYAPCADWRAAARDTLAVNRDMVAKRLPGVEMIAPEAGFLAWLDWPALALPCPAAQFFLTHAHVALSAGEEFRAGLEG